VTPLNDNELEVESPDLAKYQDEVDPATGALALEVIVITSDGSEEVLSTNQGHVVYEEFAPRVTSVTDEETDSSKGSILGGDHLRIRGDSFTTLAAGKTKVEFEVEGKVVAGPVEVSPDNDEEIEVESPDLAKYKDEVDPTTGALALEVLVITSDGSEEVTSREEPGDRFEASLPVVDSVTDAVTGADHGSIVDLPLLTLKGSGFEAPAGSPGLTVGFYHEGKRLGEEVHVPVGTFTSSEIEVAMPSLASYADLVAPGAAGLPVEVVVTVGSLAESVSSQENGAGDVYEALVPSIDSITNETADTEQSGAILGGETLRIKGAGFELPPLNSSEKLVFQDQEGTLSEVKVTPLSDSEIEVTSPDLAKYAASIPAGKDGLAANVSVVMEAEGAGVQSAEGEAGSDYAAELPKIESVVDQDTGSSTGSALGGDDLVVKGAWLQAPTGGVTEVDFHDSEGPAVVPAADVTAVSSGEALVVSPDLSAEASEGPFDDVITDLVATVSAGGESVSSRVLDEDDEGSDIFHAEGPYVTAVKNAQDGSSMGSLDGGEMLTIEGGGFLLPKGGSATVEFLDSGTDEVLDETEVTPTSAEKIELLSPDLSSYASKLDDGALTTDVRVKITDPDEQMLQSPTGSKDRFSFEALAFSSEDTTDFTVGHEEEFAIGAKGGTSVELKETGELPDGISFADLGEGEAGLGGTPAAGSTGVYDIKITASDAAGAEVTQDFTLIVQDVPGAPQNVAATAGVNAAKVFWDAPKDEGESEIESYIVTAEPGGQSTTIDGDATSATVEHLTAGTAYTFSVTAKNAIGEGEAGQSPAVVPTSSQLEDPQTATSDSAGGTASTEPVTSDGTTISADADGEGTIEVGTYSKDPVAELGDATSFFDVATTSQSSFTSASFKICGVGASSSIKWWNPANETWQPVSNQTTPSGTPLCVTVTVNTTTSPSLAELYGTMFALVTQPASTETSPGTQTSSTPTTSTPTTPAPSAPTQPAKPALGSVSLAGSTITVTSSGAAAVKLTCTGNATCSGELTLTVEGKASKAKQKHAKAQTIGKASFSIPAGKTITLHLTLNAAGKALLNAAHGHLGATLTIHQSSPAPGDTRTDNIDLVKLSPHTAPHVPGRRSKPDRG